MWEIGSIRSKSKDFHSFEISVSNESRRFMSSNVSQFDIGLVVSSELNYFNKSKFKNLINISLRLLINYYK